MQESEGEAVSAEYRRLRSELEGKYGQEYSKLAVEAERYPILGISTEGRPEIKQVDLEKEPAAIFQFRSYGRTEFGHMVHFGWWPEIPDGNLGDYYGLPASGEVTFGAGEKEGKRFLIFRQRQNIENRGGYPFTALLDPGDEVGEKAGHNDAVIIRNIFDDPILEHYILNGEREDIYNLRRILSARLEQSYLKTSVLEPTKPDLRKFITEPGAIIQTLSIAERPTVEQMAQGIASLPEELRKQYTFLVGYPSGKAFGVKNIWWEL